MKFLTQFKTFWKKFWPLLVVLILLLGAGVWYRFWGPGEFNARAFKAYNTVLASLIELRRNPQNYDAAIRAGVGYYNLSNLNKADEFYHRAITINPEAALPWNNLGNTYRELLRFEDAEEAYNKAIDLQPDIPTSHLNLANLYNRWPIDDFDRHPRIPKVLLKALDDTNRDIRILRALVNYYEGQEDQKRADQYKEEIELRSSEEDINPPQKV